MSISVGDRVSWNTPQGRTQGKVVEKKTKDFKLAGHDFTASDDEQMFVTPVQNSEYPGALAFFMGNGLRPSFTFTFNEKANFEGGPVLVGKPRAPTPHYEYVMFYVDKALLAKKDPGTIRRVLIVDAQGNRNRFDFEDVKVPQSVDPAEFQFTPPAGTAIKQN